MVRSDWLDLRGFVGITVSHLRYALAGEAT